MIYILRGKEEYFVRRKLSELLDGKDNDIVRLNGSSKTFSVAEMLDACESNSLFSAKTTVAVSEPFFLIKACSESDLKALKAYAAAPLTDTDLVLYTLEDAFNGKLSAYKAIAANAQVIDCKRLDNRNFPTYVRQVINEEGLRLNDNAIDLLTSMCKRNATLLHSNIDLLKLYPGTIDEDTVKHLCTASDESDSFELINALTGKDLSRSISSFRKSLEHDPSINGLIALLAGQLRFLYYVAYLKEQGKRKMEIAELTASQEYRITKAFETLNKLDRGSIMKMLKDLSDLDLKIKSDSTIDEKTRFELFVLDMMRRN